MNNVKSHRVNCLLLLIYAVTFTAPTFAGTPARFYWNGLTGSKAVPIIDINMNGNANLADTSHLVIPNAEIEAHIATSGFVQTLPIGDRDAFVAVLVPMGNISGKGTIFGNTFSENASGFGDPMVEFNINLMGPKVIKNIPDLIRYEPGLSLDLVVDVAIPIGEYDNSQSLNIGQNRWYGRLGTPITWQLGPWIPGKRTTLEFFPQVWLFSDNDDFAGRTLSTEPMFELDAHITHDFHKDLWGAVDLSWITGGKATLDGVSGDELDTLSAGFTLGYQINENIQLTAGYSATINDSSPTDMKSDTFMLTFIFGWHPLIDGMNRLKEN